MTATHHPDDVRRLARRERTRRLMGGALVGMGVLHVVVPDPFVEIIPAALPNPRLLNLLAAAAEGAAGGLLLSRVPGRQRAGAALAAATFVAVYPANIDMAVRAGAPTDVRAAAAWLRLPFQLPMIKAAVDLARRPR